MFRSILALVVALAIPAATHACNPVQSITSYQSSAFVAPIVVQPVYQPVYQAQVQAVQVQAVAYAPVVQQVAIGHHCRQAVRVQRQRIRVRPARVQQVNVQVY